MLSGMKTPNESMKEVQILDDSFIGPFIPILFIIFLLCMAQLNCMIERRRFENDRPNSRRME